jgi:dTDP-4-dehydrorhamnose 3,5-epimerase
MMEIAPLTIDGAAVARTTPHEDDRGMFARLFDHAALQPFLYDKRIKQVNHSRTTGQGTIRGMHYQTKPALEVKLVRCLRGSVFDVVLDLRRNSPTFLHWHAEELAAEAMNMLIVPEGCAHGFQTLQADCELLYMHTATYAPDHESGVRYDDPAIGIDWPLRATEVSLRDRGHALLDDTFTGVVV